jgi:3'(2'), 5'-bisphosphate nucleotidase
MQPLIHGNKKHTWSNSAQRVQVSAIDDPALATFCEPVEKANTNHSFTAGVAHSMGLKCVVFLLLFPTCLEFKLFFPLHG